MESFVTSSCPRVLLRLLGRCGSARTVSGLHRFDKAIEKSRSLCHQPITSAAPCSQTASLLQSGFYQNMFRAPCSSITQEHTPIDSPMLEIALRKRRHRSDESIDRPCLFWLPSEKDGSSGLFSLKIPGQDEFQLAWIDSCQRPAVTSTAGLRLV
jgi:hypothetical protein